MGLEVGCWLRVLTGVGGGEWVGNQFFLGSGRMPPFNILPPPSLVKATQKFQINMVPTPTVAWTRP